MSGTLTVTHMGLAGVNVDKNPLELADNDLQKSQNGIATTTSGQSSLRKRPGLVRFTTTATAGTVLGGSDLTAPDESSGGIHSLYVGRGPA